MKKILLIVLLVSLTVFATACGNSDDASYKTDVLAGDLCTQIGEEIGLAPDAMAFSDEGRISAEHLSDVDFEITQSVAAYSSSVSTSLNEIVIVQAKTAEDVATLNTQVEASVSNMKEIRTTYADYLPEEYEKVENTKITQVGNYIMYTVLDSEMEAAAISAMKNVLSS